MSEQIDIAVDLGVVTVALGRGLFCRGHNLPTQDGECVAGPGSSLWSCAVAGEFHQFWDRWGSVAAEEFETVGCEEALAPVGPFFEPSTERASADPIGDMPDDEGGRGGAARILLNPYKQIGDGVGANGLYGLPVLAAEAVSWICWINLAVVGVFLEPSPEGSALVGGSRSAGGRDQHYENCCGEQTAEEHREGLCPLAHGRNLHRLASALNSQLPALN